MLEVTKVEFDGVEYLKLKVLGLDSDLVTAITSIPGWFKAQEPMAFGLPYSAAEELKAKTNDFMVVWKSAEDVMGSMVKGIDTSMLSESYCVPYEPKKPLRPHQIQGFNLLMERDGLLISDQEGVGKTPQVLCSHEAKVMHGVVGWGLYVTKAALTYDVYNQAKEFTNLRVVVVSGTPKKRVELYADLENKDIADLVVVSYELFRKDIHQFVAFNESKPFSVMYCDEMHKAKSMNAEVSALLHKIESRQRYAITATPIINEVIDMYNIMNWIGVFQINYWHFKNKFCVLDGFGNVKRYRNLGELKVVLQSNMLRRLKTDVLKDLPPVVNKYIYCEMSPAQKKLYKAVEDGAEDIDFEELDFDDIPTQLVKFARLGQIALSTEVVGGEAGKKGSGKLAELESLLAEIVDRGEKAVVFSKSKRFVKIMMEHFKEYNPATVSGDISSQAKGGQEVSPRQQQVDKFQNDETCKVIFCVSAASREGITLTRANNLIFTDKDWSPAYVSQAIGRIWRYGAQVHDSVNVYSLISKDTIDEEVEQLLSEKQFTINAMVETPMATSDILKILNGVA